MADRSDDRAERDSRRTVRLPALRPEGVGMTPHVEDGPSCPGCGLANYSGLCPVCRGDEDGYRDELQFAFGPWYQDEDDRSVDGVELKCSQPSGESVAARDKSDRCQRGTPSEGERTRSDGQAGRAHPSLATGNGDH